MTIKDRPDFNRERDNPEYPIPPNNVNVMHPYNHNRKAIDIRWDDPSHRDENAGFDLLGVNIYRSFDSEFGPYHRLNDTPVGSTFWRDQTEVTQITEDVSDRFRSAGTDEAGEWVFEVRNTPIVKPNTNGEPTDLPSDVVVTVDGEDSRVHRVDGEAGEVFLSDLDTYDMEANDHVPNPLPDPDSTVECTYYYRDNHIQPDWNHRIFYRVTTVGRRTFDNELVESPLKWAEAKHLHEMENLSYIWREAIRRNRWILEQGGERVKVFIRKFQGEQCACWGDREHRTARHDCDICYGTGIVGGFEGPYDLLIAPRDSERSINYEERGVHQEQTDAVWTGPSPRLSQKDFIVKTNGDRFSIGAVELPTNRGTVLQQHFDISLMDRNDIRHEVPVTGVDDFTYPGTRTKRHGEDDGEQISPQVTDKEETPDGIEERGRTPTYENINY